MIIDLTDDEGDFISIIDDTGEFGFQGSVELLKFRRLIPKYVAHVRTRTGAGAECHVFTLTKKGRRLAQQIENRRLGRLMAQDRKW